LVRPKNAHLRRAAVIIHNVSTSGKQNTRAKPRTAVKVSHLVVVQSSWVPSAARGGRASLLQASRRIFRSSSVPSLRADMPGKRSPRQRRSQSKSCARNPDQVGFAVNPRRWVVERFFAWIGRNRRLAKDFEATIDSARAFLYAASVMLRLHLCAARSLDTWCAPIRATGCAGPS
jgi:transposase